MLRPYPEKNLSEAKAIFNYRLSRARRIIENTFGILAARCVHVHVLLFLTSHYILSIVYRWRLFRRPIIADPDRVVAFTKAAIALHKNYYLRTEESSVYCPPGFVDGEDGAGNIIDGSWRGDEEPVTGFESLGSIGGNR